MAGTSFDPESRAPALEAHLLGRIDFGECLALQERLVGQLAQRDDGQICLLVCEHPAIVTVGRGGSPAEVELDSGPLRSRQLEVRWVKRGGGCLVHAPGQVAVYPMVPLRWHGLSVGEHLDRLQSAVLGTLSELGISGQTAPDRHGIWGRTGQLAAFGVAVRHGVTLHGAFINVCPPLGLFRLVETDPKGHTRMSCLVAERNKPARMATVRAELVRRLAEAFGCGRYHLHTGHPMLRRRYVKQR